MTKKPEPSSSKRIEALVRALPDGAMLVQAPNINVERRHGLLLIRLSHGDNHNLLPPILLKIPKPALFERAEGHGGGGGDGPKGWTTEDQRETDKWRSILEAFEDEGRQGGVSGGGEPPGHCVAYGRPQDIERLIWGCTSRGCTGYCAKSSWTRNADGSATAKCACKPGNDPTGHSSAYGPVLD
jgi:hypothetical protein